MGDRNNLRLNTQRWSRSHHRAPGTFLGLTPRQQEECDESLCQSFRHHNVSDVRLIFPEGQRRCLFAPRNQAGFPALLNGRCIHPAASRCRQRRNGSHVCRAVEFDSPVAPWACFSQFPTDCDATADSSSHRPRLAPNCRSRHSAMASNSSRRRSGFAP